MNTLAPHLSTDPETPTTAPQLPEAAALVASMQEKVAAGLEQMMERREEFKKLQEIITALRAS